MVGGEPARDPERDCVDVVELGVALERGHQHEVEREEREQHIGQHRQVDREQRPDVFFYS